MRNQQGDGTMKAESNPYLDPWLAEVYDYAYAPRLGRDVALWLALAKETGGPVLELACGSGRVLLPLARAGWEVTGLDISPHMLAAAKRRLTEEQPEVQARVRLVEGDMADFGLAEEFGLILIAAHSFQGLVDRSEQRSCLECCRRHLQPGGRLAIDVFNPRLSRLITPGGVEETEEGYAGPRGSRIRETAHTTFDLAQQKLIWRPRWERSEPDGRVTIRELTIELRYFFRFEMEWMLEACSFELEALYGNFDRSPFTAESPEMIFVARRGA
jgi:SAM-dependent methyltransferase